MPGSTSSWQRHRAAPAGELDQVHDPAVGDGDPGPDAAGDVFFKANASALAPRGGARRRSSAQRRPDCVPPLLAVDLERGWMLMADGGTTAARAHRGGARADALARRPAALRERAGRPDGGRRRAARARGPRSPARRRCPAMRRGDARRARGAARPTSGAGSRDAVPGVRGDVRRARRATASRRRSSTTTSTTARSTSRTAATCCSTGAMPASRTRSSRMAVTLDGVIAWGRRRRRGLRSTRRRTATPTSSRSRARPGEDDARRRLRHRAAARLGLPRGQRAPRRIRAAEHTARAAAHVPRRPSVAIAEPGASG